MTSPKQPPPILPGLPADLGDPAAIDSWYTAWNQWISEEASKQGWSWLKPMTPAMLHEIVEQEKQRRAVVGARNTHNNDLIAARTELDEVESRLRTSDPSFEAKRRILLPVLIPLFKRVPPAQWRELYEVAHSQLRLFESQTEDAYQREVEIAKAAIRNLESQYRANDPDFVKKDALLKTVLLPVMKNMHATRWIYAYQQSYANINLPQHSPPESGAASTDIALIGPDGVRRIFGDENRATEYLNSLPTEDGVVIVGGPPSCWLNITGLSQLISDVGAPHSNYSDIKTKIAYEFTRAGYERWRSALYQVFVDVRSKVEASISPQSPFSAEWERQYRNWLLGECWVRGVQNYLDGHIDFESLRHLVRREIEAKRMMPTHYFCHWVRDYFTSENGDYDLLPHDVERVKRFTASILRGDQSAFERRKREQEERWYVADEEGRKKEAVREARERLKRSIDGGDLIAYRKKMDVKRAWLDRLLLGCWLALFAIIAVVVAEVAKTFHSHGYPWWKVFTAMIVIFVGACVVGKVMEWVSSAMWWRLGGKKFRFEALLAWMINNDMPSRSQAMLEKKSVITGWEGRQSS